MEEIKNILISKMHSNSLMVKLEAENAYSTCTSEIALVDDKRTLIESKLRRYIYLGDKYSIYVSPLFREHFWKNDSHSFEVICIEIIGKIVKNNNIGEINSVVPLLLKINKTNPLNCDQHMIFALAVCAKFTLPRCSQMIHDAYDAVRPVCRNGLHILMFVKYCITASKMLHEHGYLPRIPKLNGKSFRQTIQNWYLKRDPLDAINMILKTKHFQCMTHKYVMSVAKIVSDDPLQRIMIIHTKRSINYVKSYYDSMLRGFRYFINKDREDIELLKNLITLVYKYLRKFHKIHNMSERTLLDFTMCNSMGKILNRSDPNVNKKNNVKFLATLIQQLPLRTLMDYANTFAKRGLFNTPNGDIGGLVYMNRFYQTIELKKSQIHPIEFCVEYIKYIKSGEKISQILLSKDPSNWKCLSKNKKSGFDFCSEKENYVELPKELSKSNAQLVDLSLKKTRTFMKPIPKKLSWFIKFLSNDLMQRSFKNIQSTKRRMLIAYDPQEFVKTHITKFGHEKSVHIFEAITMIILSLIYPIKDQEPKPLICKLGNSPQRFSQIYIDYDQPITFEYLVQLLFNGGHPIRINKSKPVISKSVYPLATMNWARKRGIIYDIFVFLGTNKMDFKYLTEIKNRYSNFSGKRTKIIICCLTGAHKSQIDLSHEGMLFIPGFDKYVGQIIQSFICDEF